MTIHREGRVFLIICAIVLGALNVLVAPYLPAILAWLLGIASFVFFFLFLQFFRIPKRNYTKQADAIVCPADGKVVIIEKVFEDEYFMDERIQISIFMSPLNVHQNLVPIKGIIEYYKYHPGKYLVAFNPKSSKLNERNTTVIRTDTGSKVLMRQIAGAVARRICYYLKQGQEVTQSQELGFIKFGSRVDLFLPLDADIKVQLEQKVTGGIDVIAVMG